MPEGYRVALITGLGSAVEVDEVCFDYLDGMSVLKGDVTDLVDMAGYYGRLYYFVEQRCHGIPLMLTTHPGRPRFWWTFRNCKEPQTVGLHNISWINSQPYAPSITSAEFFVGVMNGVLEEYEKENPDIGKSSLDEWLAQMIVLFSAQPYLDVVAKSVNPCIGQIADEDDETKTIPYLEAYVVVFRDGSRMRIEDAGFIVMQDSTCLVPVLSPVKQSWTDFRQVKLYPYSNIGSMLQ